MVVLRLFKGKNIDRASLYSPDRRPLPRCHAKTRRDLRERILWWLQNAKEQDSGIFWIEGPAGVGKSAIAQTIGEDTRRISRLGAVFFVSYQDDPRSIIPTLAYQLQLFYPEYKQIILQQLERDPTILDMEIDDQFAELITKPFAILLEQGWFSARNPLLIILDGLGECRNEAEQCQVIKLIHNFAQQNRGLPLLWMVTTRPERQFSSLTSTITCIRDRLSVDDDRAKEDVRRMLEAGFHDIRERYADMLGMEEAWPSEEQLGRIAEAAGGLFALASAALRFIDDEGVKSPDTQLEKFMEYMRCPLPTMQTNPLHPLDALYGRILSAINPEIFNTTTRILSFHVLYPESNLSARDVANFLCIRRGPFYAALDPLRSVIDVPSAKEAHDRGIRFYHSSFVSYLRQPERSGNYSLQENYARCDIAIHCIRWYNYWLQRHCKLEAEGTPFDRWRRDSAIATLIDLMLDGTATCHGSSLPKAEWPGSHKGYPDDPYPFHPRLETFAQSWCWDTCKHVDTQDLPTVMEELRQLNFCHLRKFHAGTRQCREMIKWIVSLVGV